MYSGYGTGFNARRNFSISNRSGFYKNVIIFGTNHNTVTISVHIGNEKQYILILGKGPIEGLDNTILNAEKEYAINFVSNKRNFV